MVLKVLHSVNLSSKKSYITYEEKPQMKVISFQKHRHGYVIHSKSYKLTVYYSGSVCFPLHDSGGGRRVSYSQGYPSYPAIPRVVPGAAPRVVPEAVPRQKE